MEDIQGLLEKINREGIEKAEAEAKQIVEAAKAKAAAIVKESEAAAAKAKSDAEVAAKDYASRAAETVRQAARDVVLEVKDSVTALLEKLLVKNVDATLAEPAVASKLVADTIQQLVGAGEIACGAKLAETLKAQLAAKGNFTVVTDDTLGSGFSVKMDGGRVEHAFTVEAIADELAKRLRPDLAKLVK